MVALPEISPAGGLEHDDRDTYTFVPGTSSVVEFPFGAGVWPSDLENVDTLDWMVRADYVFWFDDNMSLHIRVLTSTGGVLAAANSSGDRETVVTAYAGMPSSEVEYFGSFSYVDTSATLTDWENAVVELSQDYSSNMAGDDGRWRLDEVNLTGTYTASTTAHVGSATSTLPELTQTADATASAPQDPANLQASQVGVDVILTWDTPMSGATHVDVFRRSGTDTSPFDPSIDSPLARVIAATTTYTDVAPAPDEYVYQVFSVVEGG